MYVTVKVDKMPDGITVTVMKRLSTVLILPSPWHDTTARGVVVGWLNGTRSWMVINRHMIFPCGDLYRASGKMKQI